MKLRLLLFLPYISLFAINTQAAEIAFFKSFAPNGQPIIFEGLYSHMAIKYGDYWLHAHPYHGIELREDISKLGPKPVILENPNYPEPDQEFIEKQLLMKFDIFADWNSPHFTYCSKLGGQYLNMKPTKMYYRSANWRQTKAQKYRGQLGLSPNDVYWYARRNLGFKSKGSSYFYRPKAKNCRLYL